MRLTAVEHSLLRASDEFGHSNWDRLMRSAAQLPADVFRRTSDGVKAGGYVGVVDLGWCQVELLPKIAEESSDSERRAFLLDLLNRSGLVPRPLISRASVETGRDRLLESLIAAFAERLHDELLHGVPRKYEVRDERVPQVKGRIRFGALARSLPSEHHRMPVRHAPLQHDNEITRSLRALVEVLARESVSPRILETLEHCDRMLGAATRKPLYRLRPGRVRLSTQEVRWRPYLDLAETVRRGQVPIPIHPGREEAFGLLFSLHDVFERLIRRTLAGRSFREITLQHPPVRPRLLHPIPRGTPVITLRPDLLFADGSGNLTLVADAKWKRLDKTSPSLGLTPGDVYQVATYMAAHSVDRGILLFPELSWMSVREVPWQRKFSLAGGQGQLTVGGVDAVGLASRNRIRRKEAIERLMTLLTSAQDRADS